MSSVLTVEPPNDNVICPNCRSVVVAALFCSHCCAPLTFKASRAALSAGFGPSLSAEEVAAQSPPPVRTSVTVPIESLTASEVDVNPDMDPRLQRMVMRRQQGVRKLATSSTGTDEVAVVAKVTDVAAWEALSEVRPGVVIESTGGSDDDGTTLVTGRIPLQRVEAVRSQPFVKSLKPGQRVTTTLDRTTAETGARPAQLPAQHRADGGRGVVVGIVDFGCDYAHENLRKADGSSRVLALWDQAGQSGPGSPFGYGRLYRKSEIDAALGQPNPYNALDYAPPPDTPWEVGTHGTHVADIAAGNGRGSNIPGVAPNADIVFVEVAASDIPWEGTQAVGKSFGDSVQLLEAVRFVFDTAGTRPCVVNLSLGTNGGPHDGTTLVEEGIDRLLRQAPNRAVVISASNSFADGIHAAGTVPAGGSVDIVWNVPTGDATNNELELWYAGADRFTLEVLAPNGSSQLTVGPGQTQSLNSGNRVVLLASNRLDDPNNHDNMIGVFLEHGLPVGRWTLRLHGTAVTDGRFHAWIERDDDGQSSFRASPQDNSHTLGSVSCGRLSIAVGSYDAHKAARPLSYFSSAGPTRDGRQKPEISAPGHDVFAAHSRTRTRTTRKSGTSMAAPAVTGVIALMLAEARARGASLTVTQIRDVLIGTARRSPPSGSAWDSRFGHGRVSAARAVERVIALSPASKKSAKSGKSGKSAKSTKSAKSGKSAAKSAPASKGGAKKSGAKKGGAKKGSAKKKG